MKEQVIVFEGEQMFVAPKKRISNKSKGIQIEVPEVNVEGDPSSSTSPSEPAEPVRIITTPPSGSGDINIRQPQTFDIRVPSGGGGGGTTMGTLPERLPAGDVVTPPSPVDLGNPTRRLPQAGEETTTTTLTTTTTAAPVETKILLAPTLLGSAPVRGGGAIGGGGGGGGQEEAVVPEKKSYLWLWILLAGGAIYFLTKKKK